MVSDNLLMLDKVIKKTHAVLLSIYMNLPKRIKWRFKGSLTSKQMSRGKKYFGWENYPVEFVSNKFK